MDDWLTIRVELVGRLDAAPAPSGALAPGPGAAVSDAPPGRVLLVSGRHRFAELAVAVDAALGRWDLDRPRRFAVEGRELADSAGVSELDADDDLDVEVGGVGLREGSRFTYLFDDVWLHRCTVTATGVDPIATSGVAPDAPRPVFGWGTLPDQDARVAEQGPVGPPAADDVLRADWAAAEAAAVRLLAERTADPMPAEPPPEAATVSGAVERVRARSGPDGDWAARVLWAAAGAGARDDEDPATAWLALAAAAAAPTHVPPEVDDDTAAAWAAVEPVDLAAAVVVLVRGGVGASAQPEALLAAMAAVPEADLAALPADEEDLLVDGLDVVGDLWRALGALDAQRRLTPLGRWGLPAALRAAWSRPDA